MTRTANPKLARSIARLRASQAFGVSASGSGMFRKDLVSFLHEHPMSVAEIAKAFGISPKEVEDDLQHLRKSLKKSAYRLKVQPAACRKCPFVFSTEKFSKPGKCPQCRGTWIEAPLIEISSNSAG